MALIEPLMVLVRAWAVQGEPLIVLWGSVVVLVGPAVVPEFAKEFEGI